MKKPFILVLCALWAQGALAESPDMEAANALYEQARVYASENDDKLMAKAFECYQKAADAGHVEAKTALALCYLHGQGVDRAVPMGVMMLFEYTAEKNASATYELALCYLSGMGVDQSELEAMKLFIRAAELGNAPAQWQLGTIYMLGQMVKADPELAFKYTQQAAEQGYAPALFNLAAYYENGNGTTVDRQKALYWYQKASDSGDDHAAQKVAELQSK